MKLGKTAVVLVALGSMALGCKEKAPPSAAAGGDEASGVGAVQPDYQDFKNGMYAAVEDTTATFTDNFNRPDSTTIGNGWTESGNVVIGGGTVRAAVTGTSQIVQASRSIAAGVVSAYIDNTSDPTGRVNTFVELLARRSSSGAGYAARYGRNSQGQATVQINVCTASATTSCRTLAQGTVAEKSGTIHFVLSGRNLALYVNERSVLTTTDSRYTSGATGLRFISDYGPLVDNFRIGTALPPTSQPPGPTPTPPAPTPPAPTPPAPTPPAPIPPAPTPPTPPAPIPPVPTPSTAVVNKTDIDLALREGVKALFNNMDPNNGGKPFFEVYSLNKSTVQSRLGLPIYPSGRAEAAGQKFVGDLLSNVTGRTLHTFALIAEALGLSPDAYQPGLGYLTDDMWLMVHRPKNGNWNDLRPANQTAVGIVPGDPKAYQSNVRAAYYLFNQGASMRGMFGMFKLAADKDKVDTRFGRSIRDLIEVSLYNLKTYYVQDASGKAVYNWERYRSTFGLTGGQDWGATSTNWTGYYNKYVDAFVLYAMLDYYEATGSPTAIELLRGLKIYSLDNMFPAGMQLLLKHGHMYEVVAGINSHARLAMIDNDQATLTRMRGYFDSLFTLGAAMQSGWVPERHWGATAGLGKEGTLLSSDTGEVNCTGELVEAAIRFGNAGFPSYYAYAERAVRNHMLPAQLLDTANLTENTKLAGLLKGSFGFPAPYGPIPVKNPYYVSGYFQDITSGALASLAVVRHNAHQVRGKDLYIPLHFDLDTAKAKVTSPYTQAGAPLRVQAKQAYEKIYVRAPSWMDRADFTARIAQGPHAGQVTLTTDWIVINAANSTAAWDLPLTLRPTRTEETLNGRALVTDWLGDAVTSMTNFNAPYGFFR